MIKLYSYSFSELDLDKQTIKDVLGNATAEENDLVDGILEEIFSEAEQHCSIVGGYQIHEDITLNKKDYTLNIDGKNFEVNKRIGVFLRDLDKIAVFLCTAGEGLSSWSAREMQENILKGYIIDILGSEIVEAAMDKIQKQLSSEIEDSGLKITNRYSPGYCNWHLSEQHKLFSLVPDNFCGVQLTDSALMQPIKSISGIIGIGKKAKYHNYMCNLCDLDNCIYRRHAAAEAS
jgi:hypothetical protein